MTSLGDLTALEHGEQRHYPRDDTLPAQVTAWAGRTPHARAVVAPGGVLTYRQLIERSTRLCHGLRAHGVAAGDVLAVQEGRTTERIVTYLAILMAGASYLPLDDLNPPERNAFMVADSGAVAVLAPADRDPQVPVPVIDVARAVRSGDASSPGDLPTGTASDTAYVMYTSGSTGRPKGIAVPHHAITRLVVNTDYLTLGPGDVVAHGSNASFDAATFEIWGALLNGATLVGLDTEDMLVHHQLTRFVGEHSVSALFLTTAVFHAHADEAPAALSKVGTVLVGGEVVDPGAVAAVLGASGARVLHVYGPTEATTFSTSLDVQPRHLAADRLSIGRPVANTQVAILREGERVPVGDVGELHIGGDGLARGYVGRDELTRELFVPDPLDPQRTLYRTGDSARWNEDGTVDFLGRMDNQVKLRGFRVELGEVEAALRAHPGVADACVVVQGTGALQRLVGYVATARSGDTDYHEILARSLPPFMLPSQVVELSSLPRTSNGKVDRHGLARFQDRPSTSPTRTSEEATP
ncbi:amino acid adenylation domain-containing protein [Nocardioides sp. InS609-2]|uniref:amino acid adenylation domain-containing protein n=1 Tax=Nocardioides sp. InS609-2 TaxID=2760705 RepID=UPI0020BE4F39|nr:amino acid adenylation domain-containing protein [Nocardioides sp. InS609-2]